MPSQSRQYRDEASRPSRHQASQVLNDHAPSLIVKLRVETMEGTTIKEEPRSSASASPPAVSPAQSKPRAEMPLPSESSLTAPTKRSSSDRDDDGDEGTTAAKRQRTTSPPHDSPQRAAAEDQPRSPSATWEERITAVPYAEPLFDDEPTRLLQRSIAIALSQVGFDSASKEAMDAFCSEANSFAERFLSYVTESMEASRRAQPILLDFEYSLRRQSLTSHLLHPHLKPPVAKELTQLAFELEDIHLEDTGVPPALLGQELSGETDKLTKSYIPKKFPPFPSKHTYKATEVMPERETDPRKIREKATEAARHGEEALRRLVGIGKVSDQKGVKKAMIKSQEKRLKHELWEKAMADMTMNSGADAIKQDGLEQGVLIDAEKKYSRQPITRTRA